jgi:competence protein ComEC
MNSAPLSEQRNGFAGILPWHYHFAFFLCGLSAVHSPWPAGTVAILLLAFRPRLVPAAQGRFQAPLFFLLGVGVAFWLAPSKQKPVPTWMQEGQKVQVRAKVGAVRPKPEHRLQIILEHVDCTLSGGVTRRLPSGVVWTWKNPAQRIHPGQTVRARFKIKPVRGFINPGTWDSRFYWALRGVGYRTFTERDEVHVEVAGNIGGLRRARDRLRETIERHAGTGPGGSLLLALLMGDRSRLSYDHLDLIRKASLAHSLALSGLHLGFMVSLGWLLAWLAGRCKPGAYRAVPRQKLAVFLAVPLVALYLWLGQWRPSLLRAALMFFFWGALLLQGRNKVLLDGLFFALAVLVLASPLSIFDLGLQLSVAAVAGIVLLWPLLSGPIQRQARGGFCRAAACAPLLVLLVSIIANAALLPLMAWNFGLLSPHLYLNVLWLPVLGWAVLPLGLLGLGIASIPGLEFAGAPILAAAARILEILVHLLQVLDKGGLMPVWVALRPLWPQMIGYWLLLVLAAAWWKRPGRISWGIAGLALSLLLAPSLMREASLVRNQAGLQLLDVGQGQAACLSLPDGRRILIDGGGSWNREFDMGRFVLSPALTVNRAPELDRAVLSHPDYDHMRGLYYLLDRFSVHGFASNGLRPAGWDGRTLHRCLRQGDIPARILKAGDRLDLGRGLALEVLHPEATSEWGKVNNTSLALRLTSRGRGLVLIPGDLEIEGLRALLESGADLDAQALVVPHHGSRTSYCPELYRAVDPDVALVSCKYLSFFGFPHAKVAGELAQQGVPVLTTAAEGQIRVDWDLRTCEMTVWTAQHGEVLPRKR